jgi:hypothetical protein
MRAWVSEEDCTVARAGLHHSRSRRRSEGTGERWWERGVEERAAKRLFWEEENQHVGGKLLIIRTLISSGAPPMTNFLVVDAKHI